MAGKTSVRHWWLFGCVMMSVGCASLEGDDFAVYETQEGFNRWSYDTTDAVDRAVVVPIARQYAEITPNFVEQGISNFFQNLRTVASSANGFLQGKPGSGAEDLGRFVVNSTVGIGGLFDPATSVNLHYQEEDFGQTLAVWGWKKSRYIYLPMLGPTTLRDLPTRVISGYIPRAMLGSAYHWSMGGVDFVNTRANLLTSTDVRDASALDGYTFTRDAYFQRRKYLIYDGELPVDDLFDDFDDEFEDEDFDDLD